MMNLVWPFVLSISLLIQSGVGGDTVESLSWGDWSKWSLCGQCGYGISTRSRQCLRGGAYVQDVLSADSTCPGSSSQIKVCKSKPCPPEETSRNQKSCSGFNSRMFSGKQYVWEPFIHLNSACKMSCRAKGVHFYANLADRAEDGTPCKLGTADAICVTGVCKRVGCDGVVDSAAIKDICGLCGGDGSSCQTISGIFTSTELKRGLNHIISIPAGSTNINITELQPTRNLLIMQTETGTTFINDDSTSPTTSSVVEAAGTAFTYSANSLFIHKDSISSPGPTNTSVILKLLMRGSNPGIMYTFNVPNGVSGTVIQQIRYHSHPVELSPEPNNDRHDHFEAFGSKHDDSALFRNHSVKPVESSSNHPFLGQHDSRDNQDENQEDSTNIINYGEITSPSFSAAPLITHDSISSIGNEDSNNANSDIIHNLPQNGQNFDDMSNQTTPFSAVEFPQVPVARTLDDNRNVDYWDIQQSTEASTTQSNKHIHEYSNDDNDVVDNVDENSVNSETTIIPEGIIDDIINNSYKNNNREANNGTKHLTSISNSGSELGTDEVRSVINDHTFRGMSLNGDEVLQRSTQSFNNIVDTRDLGQSNSNSESDEGNTGRSNSNSEGDGGNTGRTNSNSESDEGNTGRSNSNIESDEGNTGQSNSNSESDEGNTRRSNSKSASDEHHGFQIKSSSKDSLEPSTLNGYSNTRQQERETESKPSQTTGSNDRLEKNRESTLKSHKNHSNYKIPRYSQSFTFAERYKGNYSSNQSNDNSQRSKPQHTRRQHNQQKISPKTSSTHHSIHDDSINSHYNQQPEVDGRPNRNLDHVRGVDPGHSGLGTIENKGSREPSTSSHVDRRTQHVDRRTQHADRRTQHIASDRYQSDRDEQINLRNRQVIMEERRRQMEEQRSRYNQRLQEYNEKLRQRQSEIDESRRQSSQIRDTPRKIDSRNAVNHRGPYQHETIPSLSSRDGIGLTSNVQGGQSYGSVRKPQSLESDRADASSNTQGYGRSHGKNGNTHTYTDSKHIIALSGHSSDIRHQEQISRISGEQSQIDTSRRRQTVYLPSTREGDTKDSSHVINRESWKNHNSDHHNNERQTGIPRDISSGQEVSSNVPVVIQPPRLEYPESIDGDRANTYPSRTIPRAQPSEPRYIPGGASRGAAHSALTGAESQDTSFSKISSDNPSSSSRQSSVFKPVGSADILPNHIPLNKQETGHNVHSSIYEWRISGLTECTHSCGGGVQQTIVVCVDTLTQAVVTDENCRHIPKPKLTGVPCNTRPCSAEWSPGPWSSCSVTCGKGDTTRTVTCQARVSPTLTMTMPNSNCESQEQIPNRQACSNKPCSSWRVGVWSNCSAPCGDGHKTRDVQCVDLQNNIVSDDACSELMPDSEEMCSLGECGKGWFFTDWPAECTVECGTGEVTRNVFCADDTGSALPDSRCDVSQRPAVSQSCRVSRPCGGLWFTGQWSKCDAKCGSGNKQRAVLCIKELPGGVRAVVDKENCEDLDKPAQLEPCQTSPCTSEWYMTSWSQCSQSCGTGYRTREVKCLDPDQKLHDDCPLQSRPKTRDACNTHTCTDIEAGTNEETSDCVDKFAQCNVVKRARLCQYSYYKTVCCKSCADDT